MWRCVSIWCSACETAEFGILRGDSGTKGMTTTLILKSRLWPLQGSACDTVLEITASRKAAWPSKISCKCRQGPSQHREQEGGRLFSVVLTDRVSDTNWNTRFHLNTKNFFTVRMPKNNSVVQKGSGISLHGDTQNWTGHNPWQPVLAYQPISLILWFCEIFPVSSNAKRDTAAESLMCGIGRQGHKLLQWGTGTVLERQSWSSAPLQEPSRFIKYIVYSVCSTTDEQFYSVCFSKRHLKSCSYFFNHSNCQPLRVPLVLSSSDWMIPVCCEGDLQSKTVFPNLLLYKEFRIIINLFWFFSTSCPA